MRAIGCTVYDPRVHRDSPLSQTGQEQRITGFCETSGHTLYGIFSAGGADVANSAVAQLVEYLRQQPDQFLVVVNDPSHLGPTPESAVEAVISVDQLGSRVVCTTEGHPDPIQALYRVLSGGSQPDRRVRIREAMLAKALRGEGLGKPPYGYRIGAGLKLEEVAEEAEVVRLIFHLYIDGGLGLRSIAGQINEEGCRTRRGGPWSMVSLRDILRNSAYLGTYRRFGMRVPMAHAALVEPEAFRAVQELMRSRSVRRRGAGRQLFPLSALAYCAECGNRMIGVSRKRSWKQKDGRRMQAVYRYYQCQSRTNRGLCRYHTWPATRLEAAVENELRRLAGGAVRSDGAPKSLPAEATPVSTGRADAGARRRYLSYLKQAAEGTISLRRLRSLLAAVEGDGTALDAPGDPPAMDAVLDTAAWGHLGEGEKQSVLQRWIERVDVSDEDVRVTLRPGVLS